MKGPATELIHAGEADLCLAVPLTTPIYETTTFVFDAAQEVLAYNEGRSQKYLYSRYSNPTIVSVEKKLAAIDRAEAALAFSRSEEHTSELQSLTNLVCRLLLEKKKQALTPTARSHR